MGRKTKIITLGRPTRLRQNCKDLTQAEISVLKAGTQIEVYADKEFGAYYIDSMGWISPYWFRTKKGDQFIWEGGEKISSQLCVDMQLSTNESNWFEQLLAGGGKGISIAIFDKQFQLSHPNVKHLDRNGFKFNFSLNNPTGNDNLYDAADQHGLKCLSFLAGNPVDISNKSRGIIPEADIYLYKIADSNNNSKPVYFKNALNHAISKNVDLIVFSFGYPKSNEYYEQAKNILEPILEKANKSKIPVFCSANETIDELIRGDQYPVSSSLTISVGSLTEEEYLIQKDNISTNINYLTPKVKTLLPSEIFSENPSSNPFVEVTIESSYSNMIIAGLYALMKKFSPKKPQRILNNKIAFSKSLAFNDLLTPSSFFLISNFITNDT